MYVNIKQSTYEFLKELAKELGSQYHKITANPKYYSIEEDEEIFGLDLDCCEYFKWCTEDGEYCLTESEVVKDEDINPSSFSDFELEEELEKRGWVKIGVAKRVKHQNVFLTEKAIKRHIKSNPYLYQNPRDFMFHAFRNPELEGVINAILEIGGNETKTNKE